MCSEIVLHLNQKGENHIRRKLLNNSSRTKKGIRKWKHIDLLRVGELAIKMLILYKALSRGNAGFLRLLMILFMTLYDIHIKQGHI